jgi:hypothetical protein
LPHAEVAAVAAQNGLSCRRWSLGHSVTGHAAAWGFRCSGKSILPIFVLSFAIPSLALSLHRD